MKMNHYLFIKEDNDSFYEVHATNIKEATKALITDDNVYDDDSELLNKCLCAFNENDTNVVGLYNKFASDCISGVMVVDTIYDGRFLP